MRALLIAMGLTGLSVAATLANEPALAKTQAACKQEYAAKKAAGEATGKNEQNYLRACLAAEKSAPAPMADAAKPADDAQGGRQHRLGEKAAEPDRRSLQLPVSEQYELPIRPAQGQRRKFLTSNR
jgi:hypothetical protein